MTAAGRISILVRTNLFQKHLVPSQKQAFFSTTPIMAKFDMNSKLRMNSGHEIPIVSCLGP